MGPLGWEVLLWTHLLTPVERRRLGPLGWEVLLWTHRITPVERMPFSSVWIGVRGVLVALGAMQLHQR